MKKIVWMACGMALMCAPLSASANVRYEDPIRELHSINPYRDRQELLLTRLAANRQSVEWLS